MLFGEQRLFPGAVSPLFWDPGPTAVDFSCRTQNVVAVLISLLGKSNQCERSFFFILNRGLKPLLFCFLFTKTSKVLHSSEGGLRVRQMNERGG